MKTQDEIERTATFIPNKADRVNGLHGEARMNVVRRRTSSGEASIVANFNGVELVFSSTELGAGYEHAARIFAQLLEEASYEPCDLPKPQ